MKILMTGLSVFILAIIARGDVFHMDRKGDAIVEVSKSADEYKVICKFSPQTKFDKAVNAKFNDAKGDSLCKKGLARYLNVATNETLKISGLYSAAPVKTVGDKLCYSFGVPISGCNVEQVVVKPAPQVEPKPSDEPKQPVDNQETSKELSNAVMKNSSFLCVSKYKEVNGVRKTISHREYKRYNFKSPKDFDQFCQGEFARIRALGDANLRAVRNFRK